VPGGDVTPDGAGVPDEYEILDHHAAGGAAMRGGAMRTGALAGSLLLALLTAPLVVRHLGEADFGRYSSVLAVLAIVTGLTEGGVNTVAMRALAGSSSREERDRIMSDLLGLRLVLSGAGIVVAVVFVELAGYGGDLVLGTLCAGIGFVLSVTQSLMAAVLQTRLRFGIASAIELGRGALTAALLIVLVVAGAGVLAFLVIVIPATLLSLLVTIRVLRGSTALRPAFHPDRWLPLLRETAVFAVAVAVNSLYFRLTLVIMSLVATAEQTGDFAISFRVMEVLIGVPAIAAGAAFPIISRSARDDRERFVQASGRLYELCLLSGVLVSLLLMLGAPFIIGLITGSQEHPATDVLRIQALAMIASFVASAAGYALLSLRRHGELLFANLCSLTVVVVLALTLVPALGAQGGAIAAVVADFTLCIATTVLLMRGDGPPLPLSAVPVGLAAGGGGYLAGSLVGIHPLVQAAAGALVFLSLLVVLRRFPPEVAELVLRRPPKERSAQ
jgi:O-antigen/teichoic acid export membrane protein